MPSLKCKMSEWSKRVQYWRYCTLGLNTVLRKKPQKTTTLESCGVKKINYYLLKQN